MTLRTRFRDVPWHEARCNHLSRMLSTDETIAQWNAIRGTPVTILPHTFLAGECPACDSWMIAASNRCVTRASVELGD